MLTDPPWALLASTLSITVERKAGEKYDRIVRHRLGDKPARLDDPDACPEYVPAAGGFNIPEDEIPF